MKLRDRYIKLVEWSPEDGCYAGTSLGLFSGGIHGKNEVEVYRKLCEMIDEWIEIYQQDRQKLPPATVKNYSGKFLLRTGTGLHKAIAVRAMESGKSLNEFCVDALEETVLS
ncbi:MAG: toxin-antitoxin system HicB family antitoxin [Kiritimatiellales bacterium]